MPTTTSPEQFIVDANGNKISMILSVEYYKQILEDMHDLAIVAD